MKWRKQKVVERSAAGVHLLRFTLTLASDSSPRKVWLKHSLYRPGQLLRRPVQIRSFSIFINSKPIQDLQQSWQPSRCAQNSYTCPVSWEGCTETAQDTIPTSITRSSFVQPSISPLPCARAPQNRDQQDDTSTIGSVNKLEHR